MRKITTVPTIIVKKKIIHLLIIIIIYTTGLNLMNPIAFVPVDDRSCNALYFYISASYNSIAFFICISRVRRYVLEFER